MTARRASASHPPAAAEALKTREGFLATDLRSIAVQGLVAAEHLPPIAEAQGRARLAICVTLLPECGGDATGLRRLAARLPALPGAALPAYRSGGIMLASEGEGCLLGRSPRFVPTMWSCLAVRRAGRGDRGRGRPDARGGRHRHRQVRYFASQPWPFPMSLMIRLSREALTREITVDR